MLCTLALAARARSPLTPSSLSSALQHMSHAEDRPAAYQQQIYQAGLKGEKPRFTFDVSQWGPMAKEVLPASEHPSLAQPEARAASLASELT